MTPGQRQRRKRNLAIAAAVVLGGMTLRDAGEVFGLSPSRIHQVVKELEAETKQKTKRSVFERRRGPYRTLPTSGRPGSERRCHAPGR